MYRNVVLFPGQKLISDSGRELETHSFAEWDDAIYVDPKGNEYTLADYRRLPLAWRRECHKVFYANVVDATGKTVRREYRDPAHQLENPHLTWYIDSIGNEISENAATWPDYGIFHLTTGTEITPEEYAALPSDKRDEYAELRYCYMAGEYGVGQRLYAEKDGTRLATLAYFEPPLESTSPADAFLAEFEAAHCGRTPPADQIKDPAKIGTSDHVYETGGAVCDSCGH